MSFRALVTQAPVDGKTVSTVEALDDDRLPAGDVTVDIEWAGLNYKDGLCLTGQGGLVRTYPHVAGVDFAGRVRVSEDPRYAPGDAVVLTGWRVGETHWGGFSERARVKSDWLVPLPAGMSSRQAMVIGTAGLTAMLAINRLETLGLKPDRGEVLVTGASGGVGSIAVSLLSRLGYKVTAMSSRTENEEMLGALGATTVLERQAFLEQPDKPLEPGRYAAAIDNVGGDILGKLLRQMNYGGVVASIGNAGGIGLKTNVLPFILRAVTLTGIDSVMQPFEARVAAWARLATLFDFSAYDSNVGETGLEGLSAQAEAILRGGVTGRMLVNPKG